MTAVKYTDQSCDTIWNTQILRPHEHWDLVFESRHVLSLAVYVEVQRRRCPQGSASYGLSETKTLKVMKRLNKEDHKKYHDTVHYTQILYPRSVYLHVACNPIRHEIRKS